MATNEIRKNDIGTTFELTIKDQADAVVDLSSASTLEIHFTLPDGTTLNKTATLTTDGTDGKIEYVTVTDDLSITGSWKIQGKVVIGANTWHSDISGFVVHENLI